jgi:hypothetical protein
MSLPVNAMIFTIVPTHWRITVMVMATVSFFWMILLSTIYDCYSNGSTNLTLANWVPNRL